MDLTKLFEYGLSGILLAWFMWRDVTVVKEFTKVMEEFRDSIEYCPYNGNNKKEV